MIKIILADDHTLVRQGLRVLLESQADFRVVGEALDGYELVRLVSELDADVVVADLMMPNLNGLEALKQIKRNGSSVKFVILSMHSNASYVIRALRGGALGYVIKDANIEEVVQAVRNAVQGKRYLSSKISDQVLDVLIQGDQMEEEASLMKLTEREREILQLVAEGNTSAEIAAKLSISSRTVETHRARLMHKLRLDSQSDLIRFAIQQGVIPLDTTP